MSIKDKKEQAIYPDVRDCFDPIELGNWKLEFNYPFGFVVKNIKTPEEYHFLASSDGWVTSKHTSEANTASLAYSTRSLLNGQFYPNNTCFVDKESTNKQRRIIELQEKETLTDEEKEELLEISGLRKK